MQIIAFSPRYFPAVGGAEIHLAALLERFVRDGHQVTVVTTDALDFQYFWEPSAAQVPSEAPISHNGVEMMRFPVKHLPFTPLSYHAWRRGLWVLSRLPFTSVGLGAMLSRQTPRSPALWHWVNTTTRTADIILGMNICYEPFLWAGASLAQRLNVPFVAQPLTHLGAGASPATDPQSQFYTMAHQTAVVTQADLAVMQSPTERDFYIERGASPERFTVVSPGIDLERYGLGDGGRFRAKHQLKEPIVAYIGTHDRDKGTLDLIKAVSQLWQDGATCELVLAGAQTAEFAEFWAQLDDQTRERIVLLGRISDQDKHDLLAALDLFVMPSRIDSFGMVYLEAWLYEKPVIAARAWGMSDLIDDGCGGVLVPFGEASVLAGEIAGLLANPEKRQAMGRAGSIKARENYTWEEKYQTFSAALSELIP